MDNQEQPPSLSDKDKEFAYQYLSDRESYHCHKETSAYTIFAAEVAFFTALLTTNLYSKIVEKICHPKIVVIIIVFAIWLLAHRFLRWQLINRRLAALQVGTLTMALLDNLKTNTSNASSANDCKTNTSTCTCTKFRDRWIWPVYSATDVDLKDYPDWYRERFCKVYQEKGRGAVNGEWFPTIGSIFILIISLLYVFFIL